MSVLEVYSSTCQIRKILSENTGNCPYTQHCNICCSLS